MPRRESALLLFLALGLIACGAERPHAATMKEQIAKSGPQSATGEPSKQTAKSGGTGAQDDAPTGSPTNKPADTTGSDATKADKAAKSPLRITANASEIANAKTAYGTDCAGCHMPLATSAKKGRSLTQINAAVTNAAHQGIVAKWPKDVADTTDDGVDTAMLKASAMVEALK